MTMRRGELGGSRVTRLPPRSPAARIMARTFPYVIALPPASRLLRERAELHGAPWLTVGAFEPLIALLAFTVGPGVVNRQRINPLTHNHFDIASGRIPNRPEGADSTSRPKSWKGLSFWKGTVSKPRAPHARCSLTP
jgi:hypothetical protein